MIRVVGEEIRGDRATVEVELVANGQTTREKQTVVRQGGGWWVSLTPAR